jgi:molybdopterin molybdotransferase
VSRLFDTVAIVDWSAASVPSPRRQSADAIWIGVARGATVEPPAYLRTRAEAAAFLTGLIGSERAAGRRLLVGFDFPFGWPRGLARAVTGRDEALALWNWLAAVVEDADDNRNNRFAVAGRMNAALPGVGPFWGRPATVAAPGVPEKGSARADHGLPEKRLVEERVRSAQPCWKLYTTGSVGSQALLGVARLARLRAETGAAVWPFDTGLRAPEAPAVLAEIYPSLLDAAVKGRPEGEIKDAAQVRLMAEAFARLDAEGRLAPLFGAADDLTTAERDTVAREEAWILGVGRDLNPTDGRSVTVAPPRLRNDCFALPPGVHWTPVDEALDRLRAASVCVCDAETVPLFEAAGRILAEDVRALRAHPPEANAAVDGYGFAHAAMSDGRLPLLEGRAAAGAPYPAAVPPGAALRILTGSPLPPGVDTVVLEEDCRVEDGTVAFEPRLKPGANTRRAGENLDEGAVAATAGRRLTPADLAQIAAGGLGEVVVRRRLRIGVLSTGDEIAAPGAPARPGVIYDSNRPMLLSMLARMGFEPVDLGVAPDEAAAVRAALDRGAALADAILTSGGASAGDEDHMSRALREAGTISVWRIAVKPGRPLALGMWGGVPVFGLPGNPVAAWTCSLVFAWPALSVMAGAPWPTPRGVAVPAAFEKRKKAGRREFLRARLTETGAAEVYRSEGSGLIGGLSWATGFVELPDGPADVRPGEPVRFIPYESFGL